MTMQNVLSGNIVDSLLASVGSTLMFSDLFVFDTKFDDKIGGRIL